MYISYEKLLMKKVSNIYIYIFNNVHELVTDMLQHSVCNIHCPLTYSGKKIDCHSDYI